MSFVVYTAIVENQVHRSRESTHFLALRIAIFRIKLLLIKMKSRHSVTLTSACFSSDNTPLNHTSRARFVGRGRRGQNKLSIPLES